MTMNGWDLLQLNLQFYQTISQNAERTLAKDKLEAKGFFLLAAVDEFKHPADLAKRLMLPKPTVTFLIKKLEQAQYVKRKSVAGDLRRFEIQLTPTGRRVLERGRKTLSAAFDATISQLSSREREQYSELLQKCMRLTAG
jgi:DNA-binding MarR family transcriptional regulator